MEQLNNTAMEQWNNEKWNTGTETMEQQNQNNGTMEQWKNNGTGIMEQWNNGTMEKWKNGT